MIGTKIRDYPPKLQALMDQLPRMERAALAGHLHGGTSAAWIESALRQNGIKIGASTIRRWRQGNVEGRQA